MSTTVMSTILEKFGALGRLARTLAPRDRRPDFVCGDCDRWARCGLPPNALCLIKAAHLADPQRQARQRARALLRDIRAY